MKNEALADDNPSPEKVIAEETKKEDSVTETISETTAEPQIDTKADEEEVVAEDIQLPIEAEE